MSKDWILTELQLLQLHACGPIQHCCRPVKHDLTRLTSYQQIVEQSNGLKKCNVSPTNNTTHTLFGYSQKEKKFLTERMPKHLIFLFILISFHKTSEIIQLTVTRKYCMYMATKVKFRWTDDDHEVKDDPITLPCKCTGEKIRKNIVHHSKSSPSRWISNVGDTSNGLALSSYTKQLHVCKNKTDKHPLLTCPHMFKLNGCLIWQEQCIFFI